MRFFSSRVSRGLLAIAVLATVALAAGSVAHAQIAPGKGGAAWSTNSLGLAPGQVIRLTVKNVGSQTLHGESLIVSTDTPCPPLVPPCPDPPVVRSYWTLDPAAAHADEFNPDQGSVVSFNKFTAQARLQLDAPLIDSLVPSLEIVDRATGKVMQVVAPGDFSSIRPIFIPPFAFVF